MSSREEEAEALLLKALAKADNKQLCQLLAESELTVENYKKEIKYITALLIATGDARNKIIEEIEKRSNK